MDEILNKIKLGDPPKNTQVDRLHRIGVLLWLASIHHVLAACSSRRTRMRGVWEAG